MKSKKTKKKKTKMLDEVDMAQMSLFDTVKDEDVIQELMNIEISTLTPFAGLFLLPKSSAIPPAMFPHIPETPLISFAAIPAIVATTSVEIFTLPLLIKHHIF